MNVAVILASGNGSRVKQSKIPKQFIEINNKPIVIHTLERFIYNKNIDMIIVVCHPEWIDYLNNYVKENIQDNNIYIIEGGKERNNSIANAINFLKQELKIKNNDIILTHDAVRMFVSDRIINENIDMCKKFGAVDTVVATVDTIISSKDKKFISEIPNRDLLFNGQTPQTFTFDIFKELFLSNDLKNTSDACRLIIENTKHKIAMVNGDYENFKITTDFDLDYAIKILDGDKND